MEYYRLVANEAQNPVPLRLATEFAGEETEHVAALDKWLALTRGPSTTWQADPDSLPPPV